MGIAEVISTLSLVLNVFTTGRNVLRESKDGDLLHPGLLAQAHESLQYLREALRELRIALSGADAAEDPEHLLRLWERFFSSLRMFTKQVEELNLSVLSIYDREAVSQLERAFGVDNAILYDLKNRVEYHEVRQGPKPPARDIKKLQKVYDRLKVLDQDVDYEFDVLEEVLDPDSEQTRADFVAKLSILEELLDKLSEQLANFIRLNWTPKDLS